MPSKGFYLMCESKAGVGGAKSGQGAALAWVKESFGLGDGRQPACHQLFEDLRDCFEEDDDAEGGGVVVGGLTGLVQDYSIGGFQRWAVVPEGNQGGEEIADDRRVAMV